MYGVRGRYGGSWEKKNLSSTCSLRTPYGMLGGSHTRRIRPFIVVFGFLFILLVVCSTVLVALVEATYVLPRHRTPRYRTEVPPRPPPTNNQLHEPALQPHLLHGLVLPYYSDTNSLTTSTTTSVVPTSPLALLASIHLHLLTVHGVSQYFAIHYIPTNPSSFYY